MRTKMENNMVRNCLDTKKKEIDGFFGDKTNSGLNNRSFFYSSNENFDSFIGLYKIIFFESEQTSLEINNQEKKISNPCIILLNEKDSIKIDSEKKSSLHVFSFNPLTLSNYFAFQNLNETKTNKGYEEIQYDSFLLRLFTKENVDEKIIDEINFETFKDFQSLVFNLINEIRNQNDYTFEYIISCLFIELLFRIAKIDTDISKNKKKEKTILVRDIIYYLNENFNKKITIDSLSEVFNTNRTTINEVFKEYMNNTVMSYLNSLRLKVAGFMLQNTNMEIKEIMMNVGICDYSRFDRIFKKYSGTTPKEYRNKKLS